MSETRTFKVTAGHFMEVPHDTEVLSEDDLLHQYPFLGHLFNHFGLPNFETPTPFLFDAKIGYYDLRIVENWDGDEEE